MECSPTSFETNTIAESSSLLYKKNNQKSIWAKVHPDLCRAVVLFLASQLKTYGAPFEEYGQ